MWVHHRPFCRTRDTVADAGVIGVLGAGVGTARSSQVTPSAALPLQDPSKWNVGQRSDADPTALTRVAEGVGLGSTCQRATMIEPGPQRRGHATAFDELD